MTAAWPHIRAAQTKRDRFAAFLCDGASTESVRAICAELDWPLDKIETGGLRAAVQSLSVTASPSILLVDLSDCADPLRDINALAEVCEPGTIVISAGQINDVRLYRDLISSGLQDYLLKPFNPDLLRDALKHAFLILSGTRVDEDTTTRPHKSITVTSARGGCGASMVAAALADTMASQKGLTTALLDLDVHFGTAALSLNLEPGRGLSDAILNPTRIDGLFLERAMVAAGEKLSILSAEASLNQPILSDGTGYRVLQDEVKSIFECTIRDTPRDLLIYNPELLADVSQLVIVSELTLACTRDVYRLLHWLKSTAPRTEAHIVLNKVAGGGLIELTQREFEDSIEAKVTSVLPEDTKFVRRAAKLGKSLANTDATNRLVAEIEALASHLLTDAPGFEDRMGTAKHGATGLSAWLGQLGRLLPGRTKAV